MLAWMCQNSVDATATRNRRHRGSRRSRADPNRPYYWMCPDVRCPAVSEGCQTVEYIVFQYNYQVRGRTINVRCESCEYCLDAPSHATARRRRSARHNSTVSTSVSSCPQIQCPQLPTGCQDERLTDVLIGEQRCKRCPACYDSTIFNA